MFRVALATYLMIVSAAGPYACCCTAARLFDLASTPTSPAPRPGHSCCGHHHSATNPTSRNETPKKNRKAPDDPQCPCKSNVKCGAALPVVLDETRSVSNPEQFATAFLSLNLFETPVSLTEGDCRLPPRFAAEPFLSKDDLLRAHHLLRC